MDFMKAIEELVQERDKLDRAIATLEGLSNHAPRQKKAGEDEKPCRRTRDV